MSNARGRLFFLSFLMLFVELALIRWLGSNVLYLSYFSNFVLLGSFLGIGVGFLRCKAGRDLFPWSATALAALVIFVSAFPVEVDRSGGQLIYFGATNAASGLPMWLMLPVIFAMVALVMAAIAQGVSRTFALFGSLEAYRLDILGSLAGICVFSLFSFLSAPPLVWGVVVAILFTLLYARSLRLLQAVALVGMLIVLGHETFTPGNSWSPYYKIHVFNIVPHVEGLNVNGIPHQTIQSIAHRRLTEPAYFLPYEHMRSKPLNDVLIIGAGNGGDVAIALAYGAKHVDAVEIDPQIYQIGRDLNPNRPYQDPRVSIHINDGRAFLRQTHKKYDLILFALPDSLVLIAGQSSLRLESYLFTLEAMRSARSHLTATGAFGMYNWYRQDWLIDRLAGTLQSVFGHAPCVDSVGTLGRFAVLMVSPDPRRLQCGTTWTPSTRRTPVPVDDDHPFVYLESRSIPPLYLVTMAGILLISILLVRTAGGPLGKMAPYADLFFMGAAFLLLETKNVVQFALLFGTTWFVNALVFFGILVSVFVAVELARHVEIRSPSRVYIALFASLALAWAVPPDVLLALNSVMRFAAATSLAFAPIFLANLVFAARFRNVASSTVAFGANLLGAMVGGVLEYSSLVIGYRSLLFIIAGLYGVAFLLGQRRLAAEPTLSGEIPAPVPSPALP